MRQRTTQNANAVRSPGGHFARALYLPAGRLVLAGVFATVEVMLVVESALAPLTKLRRS
jgi:hypothetical protein